MPLHRRNLLAGAALLPGAGLLARPALAQGEPIRMGLMAPLTGVVASGGREMVDGVNLYVDQAGRKFAGRPVELSTEDDGSNPDTALQKARRLVEQARAHFLMGNLLANTGLAVAGYVRGNGEPYFIPIIAADELTQRGRIPNVIRTAGYSSSQTTHPFGDWAYKQGWKKVATISQDYTFGHEQCAGFCRTFTEAGGQIAQQFWHPLNTADFSPYLGQLASLGVDAIFAMETGADATRFLQQYSAFGLKQRIPLMGAMNCTDQSVIRNLGPECEGVFSAAHFAEGSDNPATRAFVAEHEKRYSRIPSLYGFSMYSGTMWVAKA
ncbi:MAG TPA: ABC transporter substrate-binding protein, partial [Crenalkalicoccus sp.]|nr:ABC transporter substrate-binding protein [Crenalkalicoccus sp.]